MRQWLKKYKPTSTISNRKAGLLPTRESVIFLIMFLLPNNLNDNTYTIVYIDKIPKTHLNVNKKIIFFKKLLNNFKSCLFSIFCHIANIIKIILPAPFKFII